MSKAQKRIDQIPPSPPLSKGGAGRQHTIFEELSRAQAERTDGAGSMRCVEELKAALNLALKKCPWSRYEVAGRISHLLNTQITKEMIDSWTADSKDRHTPGNYLPAFCAATGDDGPLLVLNRKRDLFACAGPAALKGEIDQMKEAIREQQREVRRREQLLHLFNGQAKD